MSFIRRCELCHEAQVACRCEFPPGFLCKNPISQHKETGGWHSTPTSSIPISDFQISFIRQAMAKNKVRCIREALLKRNSIIEKLTEQIKLTEEFCRSFIEEASKGEIERILEEICLTKSIPLYSENPLIQSLVTLQELSEENILRETFLFVQSLNPSLFNLVPLKVYPESIEQDISEQKETINRLQNQCKELEQRNNQQIAEHGIWIDSLLFDNEQLKEELRKENIRYQTENNDLLRKNEDLEETLQTAMSDYQTSYSNLKEEKEQINTILEEERLKLRKEQDEYSRRNREQEEKYKQEILNKKENINELMKKRMELGRREVEKMREYAMENHRLSTKLKENEMKYKQNLQEKERNCNYLQRKIEELENQLYKSRKIGKQSSMW